MNSKIRIGRKRLEPGTGRDATRDEIRQRFSDSFARLLLEPKNFCQHLRTPAERAAFAREFPDEFLDLADFLASCMDTCLNSTHYRDPFRRPAEFYETHDVTGFDFPDLAGVRYRESIGVMTAARAKFWQAKGWPMTPEEKTFVAEGQVYDSWRYRGAPSSDDGNVVVIEKEKRNE